MVMGDAEAGCCEISTYIVVIGRKPRWQSGLCLQVYVQKITKNGKKCHWFKEFSLFLGIKLLKLLILAQNDEVMQGNCSHIRQQTPSIPPFMSPVSCLLTTQLQSLFIPSSLFRSVPFLIDWNFFGWKLQLCLYRFLPPQLFFVIYVSVF